MLWALFRTCNILYLQQDERNQSIFLIISNVLLYSTVAHYTAVGFPQATATTSEAHNCSGGWLKFISSLILKLLGLTNTVYYFLRSHL